MRINNLTEEIEKNLIERKKLSIAVKKFRKISIVIKKSKSFVSISSQNVSLNT